MNDNDDSKKFDPQGRKETQPISPLSPTHPIREGEAKKGFLNDSNRDTQPLSKFNTTDAIKDDAIRKELLEAFKLEVDEYLQTLNHSLLKAEQTNNIEPSIDEIFRVAHSLKGTSGAFGLTKVQKIAHNLENLFGAVRRKDFVMTSEAFDACYEGLDAINSLIELELLGTSDIPDVDLVIKERIDKLFVQQPSANNVEPVADTIISPVEVPSAPQTIISPVVLPIINTPTPQQVPPPPPTANNFAQTVTGAAAADDAIRKELLEAFKLEVDEYLQSLNNNLLKAEQDGNIESSIDEIFRVAHSLKGTSGAFGLTKVQKIAHNLENLFGAVRRKEYVMVGEAFDVCYEGLDAINSLIELELLGIQDIPDVDLIIKEKIDKLFQNSDANGSPQTVISPVAVPIAPQTIISPVVFPITPQTPPPPPPVQAPPPQPVPYQQPAQPQQPPPLAEKQTETFAKTVTQSVADDAIRKELLEAFKLEVDEYLQSLNQNLIKAEQDGNIESSIDEIFRVAHSLKGTSGAFGLTKVQKIAHNLENLFGAVRRKEYVMVGEAFDICYEGLDAINSLIELELLGIQDVPDVDLVIKEKVDKLFQNRANDRSGDRVGTPKLPPPPAPIQRDSMPTIDIPVEMVEEPTMPVTPMAIPMSPSARDTAERMGTSVTQAVTDDAIRKELLSAFKLEVDEYLQSLNQNLMKMEQHGNTEGLIDEIFRVAHSLKGTSGAFGLIRVQKIAHNLENLFGAVRRKEFVMHGAAYDICYQGFDIINTLIDAELNGRAIPDVEQDIQNKITNLLTNRSNEVPAANVATGLVKLRTQEIEVRSAQQEIVPAPPGENLPLANDKNAVNNLTVNEAKPLTVPTQKAMEPSKVEPPAVIAKADVKTEWIRIPLNKIDRLMSDVGELLIAKSRYEQRFNEIQQISADLAQILKETMQLRPLRRKISKQLGNKFAKSKAKELEELFEIINSSSDKLKNLNSLLQGHLENSSNDDLHFELITSSIQEEVQGLRMLPIETLFEPLRRRVRDISRKQGKDIILEMYGGETELDRQLIEAMRDPLVHLITNSIDHGLEMPEDRVRMGKDPKGHLKISAGQRGNQIIIEISDDGAGIHIARVKEKALKSQLYTERELETLSHDEVVAIIFQPGFSTKAAVTEISGRGVGLDVVKVNVEKLQGQIVINTVEGAGTTFRITLPLTLSTQKLLMIKSAGQIYALPVNTIERVMSLEGNQTYMVGSQLSISIDGRSIPITALSSLLNLTPPTDQQDAPSVVMIIAQGSDRAAFIIDEVIDEQEMVVKSLSKPLRKMSNISGGIILGDGSVVLLLNPSDILRAIKTIKKFTIKLPAAKGTEVISSRRKILVIDDSLTTRMLEKTILESAGYEVILATNGAEGFQMASQSGCELIISDIEMPVMDGIELARQIKSSPKLKNIPVILHSSLDSDQIKERANEAGADAYIAKGKFDQKGFLATIETMLI